MAASADLASMIAADLSSDSAVSAPAAESPNQSTTETVQPTATEPESTDDDFALDLDKDPDADESIEPLPVDAKEQAKVEPKTDPDSEIGKLLATARGRRIYQSFQRDNILGKPEEEGGIGFTPSAEQVREYYQKSNRYALMEHRFDSGAPEHANTFLNYWFAPGKNGQPRAGVEAISKGLPEMLGKINPQMNVEIGANYAGRYVNAAIERMMEAVRSEKDESKKAAIYNAAQHLHRDAYGDWFNPEDRKGGAKQEPISREISELQRLRTERSQAQQRDQDTRIQSFQTATDASIDRALMYDADQALKLVREHYKDTPLLYESLRDRLISEVQREVKKNKDGWDSFQRRYQTAQRGTMTPEDTKQIMRAYRQLAANVIMSRRTEYLKAAGTEIKERSDAAHANLSKSAAKKNVTAGGQPAAQSIRDAIPARKPGEGQSEYMQRIIQAGISA